MSKRHARHAGDYFLSKRYRPGAEEGIAGVARFIPSRSNPAMGEKKAESNLLIDDNLNRDRRAKAEKRENQQEVNFPAAPTARQK